MLLLYADSSALRRRLFAGVLVGILAVAATPAVRAGTLESSVLSETNGRFPLHRLNVIKVQIALGHLGYDVGKADGAMGPRTRAAIVAFQKKHGVEETGEPDQQFRGLINSDEGARRAIADHMAREFSCVPVAAMVMECPSDRSGAGRETTAVASTEPGTLRFDGLYVDREPEANYYLRFYPDGTVLTVTSTGEPHQVLRWFDKEHDGASKGRYSREGAELSFSARSHAGAVDYAGIVVRDALELEVHSRINGSRYVARYAFIEP